MLFRIILRRHVSKYWTKSVILARGKIHERGERREERGERREEKGERREEKGERGIKGSGMNQKRTLSLQLVA